MYVDTFTTIIMKTRTGSTLYLKASETQVNKYEWTFNKMECIWFNTEHQAREFAKNYFKKFSKYGFEDVNAYI